MVHAAVSAPSLINYALHIQRHWRGAGVGKPIGRFYANHVIGIDI